jgi:hypothetical protein
MTVSLAILFVLLAAVAGYATARAVRLHLALRTLQAEAQDRLARDAQREQAIRALVTQVCQEQEPPDIPQDVQWFNSGEGTHIVARWSFGVSVSITPCGWEARRH